MLSGVEAARQRDERDWLLSLPPETLAQHPHLYLRRMASVPLLPAPESAQTQYPTAWGPLTFEQLYGQTQPYAAAVLRHHLPDAVEDGLQAGYLRLWEHLQTDPALLAERPVGWIGKFILYSAYRIRKRSVARTVQAADMQFDDPSDVTPLDYAVQSGGGARRSGETRQADMRHDLLAAVQATAAHINALPPGKARDRMWWALYCITSLQVQVTEAARLFGVRHRAMKAAYTAVRGQLQSHLPEYAPTEPTRPLRAKRDPLPEQDITAIRETNGSACAEQFRAVRESLHTDQPTTLERDLIALAGIEAGVSAKAQGRRHDIPKSSMQRAYERVHLLLAAQSDPSVRPRQSPRRRMQSFELSEAAVPVLRQVAGELASEHGNFVMLIALYAYVCNLPDRAVSRDFGVNEGTLRRHRYAVQGRLEIG